MELSEAAKEARRQYRRERYAKDPKVKEYNKKWRDANPEKVRAYREAALERYWEKKAREYAEHPSTSEKKADLV
jgi:hypothetical protein